MKLFFFAAAGACFLAFGIACLEKRKDAMRMIGFVLLGLVLLIFGASWGSGSP